MTFTVNSLTRCAGQNHYVVNVTVASGPTVDIQVTQADMAVDFATMADAKGAAVDRLRSAAKEANAVTFAQVQTALVGKTFKL